MSASLFAVFLIGLIGAAIRMATPILIGSMGEILSEKSGVLNLGIEGIMLMGALVGFLVARATGSLWLGVAMACLVGMAFGFLLVVLSVYLGLSQHVSGLGITILCSGLAMYVYRSVVGSPTVPPTVTPFATDPVLGQYALTYVAFAAVPLLSFVLRRTPFGLSVISVGENPFAADTAGVRVNATRTVCVVAGAGLMGVAGSFMTLAHQNMFLAEVVGGRGWVCVAMVIFGNWNPYLAAVGALGFGFLDGLQLRLQMMGLNVPFHFFLLLPYLLTLIALVALSGKSGAPAALLKPYRREEKQ